jgi:hypothetical protein
MAAETTHTQVPPVPTPETALQAAETGTHGHRLSREWAALGGSLLAAGALRLVLAARGWPYSNSDEAAIGLMVDDILRGAAHPAFTYGEHHVGALDAYLQVPGFLALGHTNFALHVTTTLQFLVFLAVLYLFTRAIFAPVVAGVAVVLLAFGPELPLLFSLRAGHYDQDVLLLGVLLLWLTFLRLRRPARLAVRRALDLGIGLVAGLGLWSTILLWPFVAAAALALVVTGWRRQTPTAPLRPHLRALLPDAPLVLLGTLVGMGPLLVVGITSRGATLAEALRVSTSGAPAPGGFLSPLVALGQQVAATFLYGLPSLFGARTVCPSCVIWPSPLTAPSLGGALAITGIGLAFSALLVSCWLRAALPLARDTRRLLRSRRSSVLAATDAQALDARWWGRAMLVLGVGLTVAQYAASRASYVSVDTAPRYLTGAYLGMPLVAEPLARGALSLWRHLRWSGPAALADRRRLRDLLASGALVALLAVSLAGASAALAESVGTDRYGVPAGERDLRLLAFLQSHRATRFYTTWWVCYRLMFDADERAACYIVSNSDVFQPGNFNRVPAYAQEVAAAPHPAYVLDLTTTEAQPSLIEQVQSLVATGDPRFAGYSSSVVRGYLVVYYAGPGA